MYFNKDFSLPTGYRFLLKDVISYIIDINKKAKKDMTLLDIGCGEQPYKSILSNYKYLGMDNYAEIQAKPDVKGSITDIPLEDKTIDICLSVWVLDDVLEIDKAMSEISRVLKDNSYYYAIENQSTHIHNPPYDYFRFAPNALKEICKRYNLELIECKSFGGDFANIGFSLIKGKFEINSLGYFYTFKRVVK